MPVRVVRGTPGSGKTELVYREFSDALRAGTPNLRLVVPTATLVRHSQHELARRGLVFSPNSVLSLSRFAREFAATTTPTPLVTDALLRAFVRDSLRHLDLPEFDRVSTTEGLADLVLDTIKLFENAAATPATLSAIRTLTPLARAFARIWQAVDDSVCRAGFLTRGALFRAAAASTQSATIWMDGFLHLSPLESTLVRALAPACDLTLTLGLSPADEEIHRFCINLGARDTVLPSRTRAPLAAIVDAPTPDREAAEIARRILDLHSAGVPLRDIAVAVRDADTYVPLLRAAFERTGIPARFYFSHALRHHPAAIFLNGLIDGALSGWDFEPLLRAFRAHPHLGAHPAFDRFDFAVRETMPARGTEEFLALAGGKLQNNQSWLHNRLAECVRISPWPEHRLRPADWAARLAQMATSLYRPAAPDPATTRPDELRSHSAALAAWIDAVASIVPFWSDPDRALPLAEFWAIAKGAIDAAVFQLPDDRTSVVHVMNVAEARQWNVRALILCGLTHRDFPRRNPENLIFPDAEIARLRKHIPLRRANSAPHELNDERSLFDALKSRATRNLILTVPAHDASGKSAERSSYLKDFDIAAVPAPLSRLAIARTPQPGRAGRIESPALLEQLAAAHRTVSATALEDLVQCPFKFFAGRTLSLKSEPNRPADRLQPRTTGSILHEALEKWQSRRDRDFVEVFEETFDEFCRREHLQPGYRLEVARFTFRNIARQAGATDQWQQPDRTFVEEEFQLSFPNGITVKGRIDRIDVFGPDCVVIDYKSSKTDRVAGLVESEAKLQGPIYALAARDFFGLNPVAMAFWAVRDDELFGWGTIPGYKGKKPLLPMPPNWADDARARASAKLTAYLAGDAAPQPYDETQCRWCDFAHACRYQREARAVPQTGGANA